LTVHIPEVCTIENVVHLPAQLNLALLTNGDVLEERQVIIEDRGQAQIISRRVTNLSEGSGKGKAARID
jgi:hypothetical protein